jgi:hypothetical protein
MKMNRIWLLLGLLLTTTAVNADPFKLPTYGQAVQGIPTDSPFSSEDAFLRVITCLPKQTKFKLDVKLVARVNTESNFDPELGSLGKYYAGIVASIPLYSSAEIDRQVEREAKFRLQISKLVMDIAKDIIVSRKALKEIGIYNMLEERAQQRIAVGVAYTNEQVSYLEKRISAEAKYDEAMFSIEHARLALTSLCTVDKRKIVDQYLQNTINYSLQYVNTQSTIIDSDR